MKIRILSASDVHDLLTFGACAQAMRDVLARLARGEAQQVARTMLQPDGAAGIMALMPSYLPGDAAGYGLKALCIMAGNPAAGLDTHQGIVLLSSTQTGEPLAVLNASAVTEIRTAAVSVVATEALARPDADVLAIIGTGVQARAHLRATAGARQLAQIRVAGRDHGKAIAFAEAMRPHSAAEIVACPSARDALAGAGLIVTATNSAVPVLQRDWIAAGAHINAVGACFPAVRELDSRTVADAVLFADSAASVHRESGDYLLALADGAIGADHVRAELGAVLAGLAPGRSAAQEITVFESLGLAIEDLAAATLTYREAIGAGAGSLADF